jgi:hypothetical protein
MARSRPSGRSDQTAWRAAHPTRPGSRARPRGRTRARPAARHRPVWEAGWDACARGPGSTASRPRTPRNPRARAIAPPGAPHTGQAPGRPAPRTSHRREDPRPVVPRADRVLAQPPPDRDRRDRRTIPRLTASIASSVLDQRDSGTPRPAGDSHASALTSATCAGGKRRRRPGRGLSSSPCNPSRQKRLRHVETAWRDCPNRPAISECTTPPRPTRSPSPAPRRGTDPHMPPCAAQARAAAHHSRPPGTETSAPSTPTLAASVMTPSDSPHIGKTTT